MTGWHISDWERAPWNVLVNYVDFWAAMNERKMTLYDQWTPVPLPTAHDILQRVGSSYPAQYAWPTLQAWAIANIYQFVRCANPDGTMRTVNYFHGKEEIDVWDVTSMTTALYGEAKGGLFRRATTPPTNWLNPSDPAYSYGVMQARDIIGPWIMHDLQRVFNWMLWTRVLAGWWWAAVKSSSSSTPAAYNHWMDWALSTAHVSANWAAEPWYSITYSSEPYCRSSYFWTHDAGGEYRYIENARQKGRLESSIYYERPYAISYFMKAGASNSLPPSMTFEFDANGDPVIQDRYSLFDTVSGSATGFIVSGWFANSDAMPAFVNTPPSVVDTGVHRGWFNISPPDAHTPCGLSVVNNAVPGGFVYT